MHDAKKNQNTNGNVVIPYYVAGAVAFFIATVLCLFSADSFFGHYFQPRLLALTHIMALGWGTMTIFGALAQFLPVLFEVPLYSEKLCRITFWSMLFGVIGLVFCFWNFEVGWPLQISSIMIIFAIVVFGINVYKTARSAKKWTVSADLISTSFVWFFLTAVAGAILVFNFRYAFLPLSHLTYLKVHAHLGIIGWFLLLIIGVSSRLIPMFLLSSKPKEKLLSWSYYLINFGLVSFIAAALIFLNTQLTWLWVAIILLGIVIYLNYIRSCYISRMRKSLDTGMRQSMVAFLFIMLPLIFVLITIFVVGEKQVLTFTMVYGFSIFFGFITTLILGQTYKTLPFIVWLKMSSEKRAGTRLPKDLFSERLAKFQFIFHLVGIVFIIPAIIFKVKVIFLLGAISLLASALMFQVNLGRILSNLFQKK